MAFWSKREAPARPAPSPLSVGLAMLDELESPAPQPPREPAPLVRPEPMQFEAVDHDALAEYVAVAESIGFSNPALARARLLNFLQREEIPVYSNERVSNFMTALVIKEHGPMSHNMGIPYGVVWVWNPLLHDRPPSTWATYGSFSGPRYAREVPLDVLKTVARVKTAFQEAKFYVTDYQSMVPDPFLCVKLDDCEHVVIAVWDEPDFKLTPKA